MVKKKILKKRAPSIEDMEWTKLRSFKGLKAYDPKIGLADRETIVKALLECIMAGESEIFKDILSAHLEVMNKEKFAKKAKVSRRTLFRMLSPEGNPRFDAVLKVMKTLAKAA